MYTGIFANNPRPLSIISIHTTTPENIFIWPLGGWLLGYWKCYDWDRETWWLFTESSWLVLFLKTFIAAVFVLLFHPFIFIFRVCLLKQAISKINNAPQYHNTYYRVHYIAFISKNLVSSFTLEVSLDYHFQRPQMPKCTEKSSF